MVEEYLDIVNEEDEVVGRDTRKNVHDNYQIHRGVHVFVINHKGEILLQKRSEDRDNYPGYYDSSVGAQVSSGETYEQAAERETFEELGFRPSNLERVCDYNSYSSKQREKKRLFKCIYDGPFNIDKVEVDFIEWYTIDQIKKEIEKKEKKFTNGFKLSFEGYLNYIK